MDESGTNEKEHFVKQRRNLVLICITTFLFKFHQSYPFIKPFSFFKENDENSFYIILSLLLVALLYTTIRYLQAMIADYGFKKIENEFNDLRDDNLLFKNKIYVDDIHYGQRKSDHQDGDPFDEINFNTRLTVNYDWGGKIEIEKFMPNEGWKKITGANFAWKRIRIGVYAFKTLFNYTFKKVAILEYMFPILFSFFAVLEIFGIELGHNLIKTISQILEYTNNSHI